MKPQRFYKEVLFDALKINIANVSILIEEGVKDNKRLVQYTNYHSAVILKSFHEFQFLNKDFTSKELALKQFKLIYGENFKNAVDNSSDLPNYLKYLIMTAK